MTARKLEDHELARRIRIVRHQELCDQIVDMNEGCEKLGVPEIDADDEGDYLILRYSRSDGKPGQDELFAAVVEISINQGLPRLCWELSHSVEIPGTREDPPDVDLETLAIFNEDTLLLAFVYAFAATEVQSYIEMAELLQFKGPKH